MRYLLIGLLVLAGLGLPAQDALNAQLRSAVKSPLLGAAIQFVVGVLVLGALALILQPQLGHLCGSSLSVVAALGPHLMPPPPGRPVQHRRRLPRLGPRQTPQ